MPEPAPPGAAGKVAGHSSEVSVGIGGLHLPQWAAEPDPDLVEVVDVAADGAIRQAGRGSGQYEPGQDVGLEISQLFRGGRCPGLPQVPDTASSTRSSPSLRLPEHQPS